MGIFDKLKRKKSINPKEVADVRSDKKNLDKKNDKVVKESKSKDKVADKAGIVAAKSIEGAHKILLKPIISEKSFRFQAESKYCFVVATDCNKQQVKKSIRELYGIAPLQVNIVNSKQSAKYRWGRQIGIKKGIKKAIVTMPAGTVLNLTE